MNGDAKAGYAWSGPGSFCCNGDGTHLVGWQIWFTNTEACPTSNADIVGNFLIVSAEKVQGPSTALPQLTSMTLPILFPDVVPDGQSVALFDVKGEADEPGGTLTLATYSGDEITGTFTASTYDIDRKTLMIRGNFDAHRCDRIHD